MRVVCLNEDNDQTFVVVFETGDEVISGLTDFARQNKVQTAFLSGVGAFQRATLAFFDLETKEYLHIPIDEQTEVMSVAGNITLYQGEPKIHSHAVVGKRDGTAHGGHVIEAIVRPTLEIFLTTSPKIIRRKMDEMVGLPLIDFDAH
jgi:predicted DNA-binding protein with PD1-like motif